MQSEYVVKVEKKQKKAVMRAGLSGRPGTLCRFRYPIALVHEVTFPPHEMWFS